MDKQRATGIVESRVFQLFIAGVICLNAVTIGFETAHLAQPIMVLLSAIDLLCLAIYVVEAWLKLHAYGWDYFRDGWNVFDFVIVATSLVILVLDLLTIGFAFPLQVARTLRLFRVVRLFKLVSMLRKLRIIVESIGRSIPSVLWTGVLLLIVLYVFDVMGVFVFGADFPDYFGNLGAGLLTLFQILTLEGWPDIARPIIEAHTLAWLYFVSFIVLTAFIILNIIVAIILDSIEESRQADRVEPGSTDVQLAQELADLKEQIAVVERLLDKTNEEKRR
ncbi:MAG: ion transporter [Coriobacteriia bacterium]|nr:ion transporter [Coriobacteriia bacterium]